MNENNHNENSSVEKKIKSNLLPKVLSFACAILLWFYVMSFDSPTYEKTFTGVPIEISNLSILTNKTGLTIISGYGNTADITLSGKKSEINKLKSSDISAYIDVENLVDAKVYSLNVQVNTEGDFSVTAVTPEYVSVYLDKRSSVTVPVEVNLADFILDSTYIMGEPELEFEEVVVTGPESVLMDIEKAVVTISPGTVTKSINANSTIELVGADSGTISNPYVKLSNSSVNVYIPVYVEKEIPLVAQYKYGFYNEDNLSLTISPEKILVRGEENVLSRLDSIPLTTIDEKKILADTRSNIKITLPAGVINVNNVNYANVALAHKGTEIISRVVDNITVNNPNDIRFTLQEDSVNIMLRCPSELVNEISSEDISVTVDLSKISNSTGIASAPVDITISSEYSDSVYEIGDYTIMVKYE